MKEKILCALKNNIEYTNYPTQFYNKPVNLRLSTPYTYIQAYKEPIIKEVNKCVEYKAFFFVTKTKNVKKEIIEGYKYYIESFNKKYEITKEEFEELISLRKEKYTEKMEKHINDLCNDKKSDKK